VEVVFSSLLFVETSIFGSIAQTFDFPSWSIETPRSAIEASVSSSAKMTVLDTTGLAIGAVNEARKAKTLVKGRSQGNASSS
jgi:hypothetical protein